MGAVDEARPRPADERAAQEDSAPASSPRWTRAKLQHARLWSQMGSWLRDDKATRWPWDAPTALPATSSVVTALHALVRRARALSASPVMALTLLRDGGGGFEILVGVRDSETNRTHPGVISTPTQRLPWTLMVEAALHATSVEPLDVTGVCLRGFRRDTSLSDGHNALRHVIESLVSRKLGAADGLERGELAYSVRAASLTLGQAGYANMERVRQREPILMLNIMVEVEAGDRVLASWPTASYSRFAWVPVDQFVEAVARRDIFLILPDADPFEMCLHGMCTSSSAGIIAHLDRARPE